MGSASSSRWEQENKFCSCDLCIDKGYFRICPATCPLMHAMEIMWVAVFSYLLAIQSRCLEVEDDLDLLQGVLVQNLIFAHCTSSAATKENSVASCFNKSLINWFWTEAIELNLRVSHRGQSHGTCAATNYGKRCCRCSCYVKIMGRLNFPLCSSLRTYSLISWVRSFECIPLCSVACL